MRLCRAILMLRLCSKITWRRLRKRFLACMLSRCYRSLGKSMWSPAPRTTGSLFSSTPVFWSRSCCVRCVRLQMRFSRFAVQMIDQRVLACSYCFVVDYADVRGE